MTNIISSIATFVHAADVAFFKDNIDTNKYFGTLCILLMALMGTLCAEDYTMRFFLMSSFGWDMSVTFLGAAAVGAILFVANLAETIMASISFGIYCLRPLMVLAALVLSFFLGHYASQLTGCLILVVLVCNVIVWISDIFKHIRK